MAQRNGLISLQAFLHKYFHKVGVDEDQFHRYHTIAADGLRDLHIHHLPIVKTTTLTIDGTNYTADYPDDYIDYVFLAVEDDDEGRWWIFTRDNTMVDKTIAGVTGADLSTVNYTIGPGSVGGKNSYYFQPDNHNRRFLFDEAYSSSTVVLKYKSTGVENVSYASTTDIEFPVYAEDAMEKYLRWMICEYDNGPASECDRREKQYNRAVMMMRNLELPSAMEILDLWLGSSNATFIRS
jgi:hypothetical protein